MKRSNRESDKRATPPETKRRGSGVNSFLAGVATVLALLALGVGGFLLYRGMQSGQVRNPLNPQTNRNSTPVAPSTPTPVSPSPEASVAIPQNPYVQPALGNKAQVELLSVMRIPGKADEVNVQMRVRRLTDAFAGNDIINVGATTARNPLANEQYQAVDSVKRSSGPIFLFNMGKQQPVDGYVVLKVPEGVNTIDILVKDTGAFRNVLISNASLIPGVESSSTTSPSSTPQIILTPNATPTDRTNNSSVSPSTKTPAPQAATPSPSTAAAPPTSIVEFQPGAFQQLAFGTKAQVELLSARRIQDPQTANRDVVNVQMRIRRLGDKVAATNIIGVGETTARNPVTSETYKAVNPRDRSTGSVSLYDIRPNASVDAYVWLRVPPGVHTLDIFIPETGAFQQVPISN